MMGILRTFYQKYLCSRSKRLLLELWDREPAASEGIIFEEVGLPNGGSALHKWWKNKHSSYYMAATRVLNDTNKDVETTSKDSIRAFDILLDRIRSADDPPLRDFAGTARDGIVYFIAWGSSKRIRALTIRNPKAGSRHDDFVKILSGAVVSRRPPKE